MNQEQINQAFEGRWRIKGNYGRITQNIATLSSSELYEHIKGMCRDFFEAGMILATRDVTFVGKGMQMEHPLTPEECFVDPRGAIQIDLGGMGKFIPEDKQFDYWWNLYDKKVGRENCVKKWSKLTTKEKEACISATPTYVASTPDKQFRKNPLSYLNQKAWNDEIIPRNNGTDKSSLDEQRKDKLASILTE